MIKIISVFIFIITFSITAKAQVKQELFDNKPHVIEGLYAFEKGDLDKSEKIFTRLLKDHPRNPVFLYNMGNIKLVQKQDKLAAHYYQIVIDLKSPLAPAAKIYMSQAVDRMGNYKKAIRLLGEAIEENLSDALYNLAMDEIELYKDYEEEFVNLANHQFERKEYERAYRNYWYAWVINPSSENNFKMGNTLLLLNNFKKAEDHFYKIKDDEIFKRAEDLMYEYGILEHIQVTKHKRVTLFFDYSSGSNSNPNTQAESETYDSDSERVVAYGGDYNFLIWKGLKAKIGVDGYRDSFKADPESKSSGLGFLLPVSYGTENFDFSITPKREKTTYGGEDYVRNSTLGFNHIYYFNKAKTSLSYTYSKYSALNSEYDYLSGKGHSFEAFYTYLFNYLDITIGYTWGKETLNDNDSSVSSNSNKAYELAFFIPLAERVSLDISTNYQISNYLADSTGFAQKDTTWTSYATLTLALRDYLSIYIRERFIKNNSNVKSDTLDYNYTQQYLAFGATFYLNF